MKRALITGITGQDGSYLTRFLLGKGYEVHGIIRRASSFNTQRIDEIYQDPHEQRPQLFLHYGDLTEGTALPNLLTQIDPDEIYHLAAQSHVMVSFQQPEYTADVVALGTLRLLEAVRNHLERTGKPVRFYQAGSSEMYGLAPPPQNELTPFHPRSPYAASKVAAHWYAVNYREAHGLFVANGILFNHESPQRGETFVTRKITRALGRIKAGLQQKLYLGNLDAQRDWGYAGDYVEAMWMMLQQPEPEDFVIATGESHSVREFLDEAAGHLGLDWRGIVELDPRYLRPSEVNWLRGDASKARQKLGWQPKVGFSELVRMMVEHDFEMARREQTLRQAGHSVVNPEAAVDKDAKIFVAGHRGLVGSAILRALEARGQRKLLVRTRAELDLTLQASVEKFFADERPEYVFLAAAKVGGILANAARPADFIRDNLLIQTHVIDAAFRYGVRKLLFLGSSCVYPKFARQPITEDQLLAAPLEPTNEPYAIAKIAGIRMCQAYRRQHGFRAISLMPTNLYGPGDNFDLENSHVLAALLRKFHDAKQNDAPAVTVWGSGQPRREFLHVDDLADAALYLLEHYDSEQIINVGTGKDITIAELAELIREIVGYEGKIVFDTSKPDGTPRKLLDISRIDAAGWRPSIGLREGIARTYNWYRDRAAARPESLSRL